VPEPTTPTVLMFMIEKPLKNEHKDCFGFKESEITF